MRPLVAAMLIGAAPLAGVADPLKIVTDIPVSQGLVAEVLGDAGTVSVLVDQGADPHSFQLRPSQARGLADADLVVWIGPEMVPWLERVLDNTGAVERLGLLDVAGTRLQEFEGDHGHEDHAAHDADKHDDDHDHAHDDDHGELGHEEADDHAHDHADEHADGHEHDHGDIDPHAWLDPANAAVWLTAIAGALGAADPENAAIYAANAEDAAARFAELKETLRAELAPVHDSPIVVFHDAYGYFAGAFDITVAGSVALGDASAPGAGRVAALRETVEEEGVVCLFREPQHNPALAERIASDTDIPLGTLDPLGALLEPGPRFYERLMRAMASEILRCAGTT